MGVLGSCWPLIGSDLLEMGLVLGAEVAGQVLGSGVRDSPVERGWVLQYF